MTSGLTCTEVGQHLPLYVGDDLESELTGRVARHLESCRPCAEVLARSQAARRALVEDAGMAPGAGVQADLWPSIRRDLAEAGLLGSGVGSPRADAPVAQRVLRSGTRARWWIPTAAAAAAAVPFLLWMARPDPSHPDQSTTTPDLVEGPSADGSAGSEAPSSLAMDASQPRVGIPGPLTQPASASSVGELPQDAAPTSSRVVSQANGLIPVGLHKRGPGEERLGERAEPYLTPFERIHLLRFDAWPDRKSRGALAGDSELR
jgi:putative zinc finger protein